MPGGFSGLGGFANGKSVAVGNTYPGGTAIAPSATANTKGSYTQLVAATAADACWCVVSFYFGPSATSSIAVDVAVGAAASEVVLFPNLLAAAIIFDQTIIEYVLPCAIPAGTRLSARAQNSATSGDSIQMQMMLFDGSFSNSNDTPGVDAIGFSSATTLGTAVTGGFSSKGSYAQLTAATSRDYCGLIATIDTQAVSKNDFYQFDIAIGAGGSEQIIIPDKWGYTNGQMFLATHAPFQVDIPAGTRLSARVLTQNGTTYGLTLYGLYK